MENKIQLDAFKPPKTRVTASPTSTIGVTPVLPTQSPVLPTLRETPSRITLSTSSEDDWWKWILIGFVTACLSFVIYYVCRKYKNKPKGRVYNKGDCSSDDSNTEHKNQSENTQKGLQRRNDSILLSGNELSDNEVYTNQNSENSTLSMTDSNNTEHKNQSENTQKGSQSGNDSSSDVSLDKLSDALSDLEKKRRILVVLFKINRVLYNIILHYIILLNSCLK